MNTAEALLAAIQLGKLASDIYAQLKAGQLTEAEAAAKWAAVRERTMRADAAWVAAGQS